MKLFDQINVIPFIDIMLVLLAIVLTTASFIAQGTIPVDLPVAETTAPLPDTEATEITLERDGSIYVDGEAVHPDALDRHLAQLSGDFHVLLRVDAGAAFGAFVGVVDRLKAHRLTHVTIVTRHAT